MIEISAPKGYRGAMNVVVTDGGLMHVELFPDCLDESTYKWRNSGWVKVDELFEVDDGYSFKVVA